jgi:hypothetical protein
MGTLQLWFCRSRSNQSRAGLVVVTRQIMGSLPTLNDEKTPPHLSRSPVPRAVRWPGGVLGDGYRSSRCWSRGRLQMQPIADSATGRNQLFSSA